MRRSIALVALALLPLAIVSFRGSGERPVIDGGNLRAELPFELIPVRATATNGLQTGDIAGRVRLVAGPDTMALPRVVVWLVGTPHYRLTDAGGEFSFSVPADTYTVRANIAGYRCGVMTVAATPDAVANVPVTCVVWPPPDQLVAVDTVTISVDTRTGIVRAFPNPLYIAPGHCVMWVSTDGPWAVHFSPISPLRHRRVSGAASDYGGGCARTDIFPGKYSYFVAVEVGGRIYTEDPELIDENEEREDSVQG